MLVTSLVRKRKTRERMHTRYLVIPRALEWEGTLQSHPLDEWMRTLGLRKSQAWLVAHWSQKPHFQLPFPL